METRHRPCFEKHTKTTCNNCHWNIYLLDIKRKKKTGLEDASRRYMEMLSPMGIPLGAMLKASTQKGVPPWDIYMSNIRGEGSVWVGDRG